MADDQLVDKLDNIGWSRMREEWETDKFEWKESAFIWMTEATNRILELEHTLRNVEAALSE